MFNFFSNIPSVSPEDAAQKMRNNSVGLIDVRSAMEYGGGHARGSKNIPLETLDGNTEALKKFTEVYVICRSGGRSAQAVRHLIAQEINAFNVSGGIFGWQSAGLPME